MSRRIEDLAPYFQAAAREFWEDLSARDSCYMIYNTARITAEQAALYAQGREELARVNALRLLADMPPISAAENRYTVTNCDGIHRKSAHQSLEALDVVVLDERGNPSWDYMRYDAEYRLIAQVASEHGLDAGGNWMTQRDGSPSPYARVGLGWDPPHVQMRR